MNKYQQSLKKSPTSAVAEESKQHQQLKMSPSTAAVEEEFNKEQQLKKSPSTSAASAVEEESINFSISISS
jgi:hypothetical protein